MNLNKIIIALGLLTLIFSAFFSCKEEVDDKPEFVTPLSHKTSAKKDTLEVTISSPFSWKLDIKEDWITANYLTGPSSLDSVILYIANNPLREKRSTYIHVGYIGTLHSGRDIHIIQDGIKNQIVVHTESLRETMNESPVKINLQANVNWTVSNLPNWITVDSISEKTLVDSTGLWSYDIDATFLKNNELYQRLDSIRFKGDDVETALSVFQDGASTLKTDSLALLELHKSTNGTSWTTKWDLSKPMSEWHGIELADIDISTGTQYRVISIALNGNMLTGTIPAEIANITLLERLWLHDNQIGGELPQSITAMTSLEALRLENNSELGGSLPLDLGNMESLNTLTIMETKMNGEIPSSIGDIKNLVNLDLSSNSFSGELPVKLGYNENLQVFIINNNFFVGKIPNSYMTNINWYNWNVTNLVCPQRGTGFTDCKEF